MENQKYLTFRIHNLHYAIESALVQEIFPLPELIPIIETNTDVVGFINLRTQIIPVIHLNWLQGYPLKECYLSDYIIVVQWEGLQIGILVHQVNEMLELDNEIIEAVPSDGFVFDINTAFLKGLAIIDSEIFFLLESQKIVRQPDTLVTLVWDKQTQLELLSQTDEEQRNFEEDQQVEEFQTLNFYDLYYPHASSEERGIFQQRAIQLQQSLEDSEEPTKSLISIAVISIGYQHYGLNLGFVKEFTDVDNLTPIPCCPKHIVGNMNLRGEIITLVDIRNVLDLPITPIEIGSKVVIIQADDIIAGLPIDKVLEVVYLKPTEITTLPTTTFYDVQFFQGCFFYHEKTLNVLDLPKILTQGGLIVNEHI